MSLPKIYEILWNEQERISIQRLILYLMSYSDSSVQW